MICIVFILATICWFMPALPLWSLQWHLLFIWYYSKKDQSALEICTTPKCSIVSAEQMHNSQSFLLEWFSFSSLRKHWLCMALLWESFFHHELANQEQNRRRFRHIVLATASFELRGSLWTSDCFILKFSLLLLVEPRASFFVIKHTYWAVLLIVLFLYLLKN